MKRHFKALSIFLILSFIVIFSSCADDTGITIYSAETSQKAESTFETTSTPEETDTKEETAENIENDYKTEYLLNTNTKKFHHPSCKSGQKIKDTNRADYNGTRDEIIAKGYSPCKICNP